MRWRVAFCGDRESWSTNGPPQSVSLGLCGAGSWRGNSAGDATRLLGCRRLQSSRRGACFSLSGGGLSAWSDCVGDSCGLFFPPSGRRCTVYCVVFPSLRAGHVSVMEMVLYTLPGAAHHHPETSQWITSFLEELCA